jgi:hypothetical protein
MRIVKLKMTISKRIPILLVILIPLLFVNCVNAIEKIDSFKSINDITIDGKWTSVDEWNDTLEESLIFSEGSGKAYLRVKHDINYLYILVDFVTYNDTKTGDGCIVVLDTKHDGGSSVQQDDLAVLIRWNSPSEIYPAIQWGGWYYNWEFLPSNFEAKSSIESENNPYSNTPHVIFEFKIPKSSLNSSSTTLGFLVFVICDNENIKGALPIIFDTQKPDNWGDLLLFNDSIQIYYDAQTAIDLASISIENAESEGRTEGLLEAKSLLNQAEDSMGLHDYNEATSLSNQASIIASEATIPTQPPEKQEDTPGFEIMLVLLAIALVLFWNRRKQV